MTSFSIFASFHIHIWESSSTHTATSSSYKTHTHTHTHLHTNTLPFPTQLAGGEWTSTTRRQEKTWKFFFFFEPKKFLPHRSTKFKNSHHHSDFCFCDASIHTNQYIILYISLVVIITHTTHNSLMVIEHTTEKKHGILLMILKKKFSSGAQFYKTLTPILDFCCDQYIHTFHTRHINRFVCFFKREIKEKSYDVVDMFGFRDVVCVRDVDFEKDSW